MGAKLDINIARMMHLNWETGLEALIEEKRPLKGLASHEDCELGLWLHGAGMQTLG